VLQCVQLTAGEGGLSLAGTDLEIYAQIHNSRVEVETPGEVLIPADKFQQIVRESIDATLTLEVDAESAQIKGEDSRFKVFVYGGESFPAMPVFEGEPDFEAAAGDLAKLIVQTKFAAARENSRYAMNGVNFERDGSKLSIVATDGHRMSLAKGQCRASSDGPQTAIVPTKVLDLLNRLLDDPEENVRIRIAENRIIFATEQATLASDLVQGNFPPYRDVIPRDTDRKATLATDGMMSAVRRASLLTNEESKGVKLSFDEGGLTLRSRAPEMGEAEINVELPRYDGEPIEIAFNPQYILDALKVVDAAEVTLEMKAPNKTALLRSGSNFLYVIMPSRPHARGSARVAEPVQVVVDRRRGPRRAARRTSPRAGPDDAAVHPVA